MRIGANANICSVLLQLAQEPALYLPKWSEEILSEVALSLAKPSFCLPPEQIDRRLKYMRRHFEEAIVTGYENLVPAMNCHLDDRHVLAAAMHFPHGPRIRKVLSSFQNRSAGDKCSRSQRLLESLRSTISSS